MPQFYPFSTEQGISFLSFVVSLIAAVISLITLLIAYKAYRKFLVQKARQDQLGVVLDLVKEIQLSRNMIIRIGHLANEPVRMGTIDELNVFAIGTHTEFTEKDRPLFFDSERNGLKWSFYSKFHSHPLLPPTIAHELNKYRIGPFSNVSWDQIVVDNPNAVILGTSLKAHSRINISRPFKTTKDFYEATNFLRQAILKWLDRYGIDDLNF